MNGGRLSATDIAAIVRDIPALPEIVTELIASIDDDGLSLERAAGRLSRDQGLSAKVLRIANSSFYGLQGRVASVREALMVLGIRVVRSLVTAAAITRSFPGLEGNSRIGGMWRHAFATASCARMIAGDLHLDPESAFTAGLIHDLGRLVLVIQYPQRYADAAAASRLQDLHRVEGERLELGLDHADVGYAVARRWRLPDVVALAVRDHHNPSLDPAASLADAVHVADAVVHALDLEDGPEECVPPLDSMAWERVAITPERLPALLQLAETSWRDAEDLTD